MSMHATDTLHESSFSDTLLDSYREILTCPNYLSNLLTCPKDFTLFGIGKYCTGTFYGMRSHIGNKVDFVRLECAPPGSHV